MRPPTNVNELFAAYRADGDPELFRAVFEQTAPSVARSVRALCNDIGQVEDIVQETYLLALHDAERFDETRSLVTWLCAIAYHKALRSRHKERRRRALLQATAQEKPLDQPVAEGDELREALFESLDRMPAGYRDVLVPYLIEQRRAFEIAERLGRSASTVRTQIARGLERLRGMLPAGVAPLALAAALLPGMIAAQRTGGAAPIEPSPPAPSLTGATRRGVITKVAAAAGVALVLFGTTRYAEPASGSPASPALGPTGTHAAHLERTVRREQVAKPTPGRHEEESAGRARLRVRVVHRTTGNAVPGLVFQLERPGDELPASASDSFAEFAPAVTNERGVAEFEDIETGWVRARFSDGAGSRLYEIRGDTDVEIDVERYAVVHAKVVGTDGVPEAGAEIWTSGCRGKGWRPPALAGRTAADGTLRFTAAESTTVAVWAKRPGRAASRLLTVPLTQEESEASLVLRSATRSIRGCVFDARGQRGVDAVVAAYGTGALAGRPPVYGRTTANGDFELSTLRPGTYRLAASARDRSLGVRDIEIYAGTDAIIDLRLRHGVHLTGRITDASGQPVSAVMIGMTMSPVDHLPHANLLWRMARSAADGTYDLQHLPGGPMRLHVVSPETGEVLWREYRVLPASGDAIWDPVVAGIQPCGELLRSLADGIRCRFNGERDPTPSATPLSSVSGRVAFSPQLSPPLRVGLVPIGNAEELPSRWAPTDLQGGFTFTQVPPARYQLMVHDWGGAGRGIETVGPVLQVTESGVHDLTIGPPAPR
ncbi:MAG: sigma-70 family RNA polymerase sigma factor [Planctomycetota bacterium]